MLQHHRRVRGLPGPQVAPAGADVARQPQRSLWVRTCKHALVLRQALTGASLLSRLQRSLPVGVQRERRGRV